MAYALPCRLCGTTNIALSGASPVPPTGSSIDGVPITMLNTDDRILLTGQSVPSSNGVWTFQGPGNPMIRPGLPDQYSIANMLDNATLIWVREGATMAGSCWGVDPAQVITVDTTGHTLARVALPPSRRGSRRRQASITT